MRSLNIATTGMVAQQMNIEVVSQNLSNMTTTGYKRQKAEFQDLLYQDYRRVGSNSSNVGTIVPTGMQMGLGVKPGAVNRILEQGTIVRTENPLDIAVQGRGYLMITLPPNGDTAYTRDGTFKISPEGEIVTSDGYQVQPGIIIPENAVDVIISNNGEVQVKIQNQVEYQTLGQLELTTFINPAGLEAIGNNLFLETPASGQPIVSIPGENGVGTLLQGFLENSNVDPVTEITQMIVSQRAYEMNSKVISTSDEMMQAVSNLK